MFDIGDEVEVLFEEGIDIFSPHNRIGQIGKVFKIRRCTLSLYPAGEVEIIVEFPTRDEITHLNWRCYSPNELALVTDNKTIEDML